MKVSGDWIGLKKIEPSKEGMRVIDEPRKIEKEYKDYLRDESNTGYGKASAIFFPVTVENVAWVLEEAALKGKTVTVSGGRTGICGGAVPEDGWLLSLERMKRVHGIFCDGFQPDNLPSDLFKGEPFFIHLEAGIRLDEISRLLRNREGIPDIGECANRFKRIKRSYFYPPDPTETTATIGGTVATNASGARTLLFGPTRKFIYGLEVVIPGGYLLRLKRGRDGSRVRNGYFELQCNDGFTLRIPVPGYRIPGTKHAAGYFSGKGMNLIDIFIGSEGTLGVVTSAIIKVIPEPETIIAGLTFFEDEDDVVRFVETARKEVKGISALEYFDFRSIELLKNVRGRQGSTSEIPKLPDGVSGVYFESFCSSGVEDVIVDKLKLWKNLIVNFSGIVESTVASLEKRDIDRFKIIRHAVPEEVNRTISEIKKRSKSIHKVGTDMAVPNGYLGEMLKFYRGKLDNSGLDYVIFGHIGNNHLHVNMIPENKRQLEVAKELYMSFARKAVEMGGTVSGEHGIGRLKKEYLKVMFTKDVIEEMKAIKRSIDPDGLLNPGVIFD